MTKAYVFDVKMTCGGCSGAVERALKKNNVEGYDISLEKQTVIVRNSERSFSEVEAIIKKTGKEVRSGKEVDTDDEQPALETAAPVIAA